MWTRDLALVVLALGVATGVALWGTWATFWERRRRLTVEKRLDDTVAIVRDGQAKSDALRAQADAERTVQEYDKGAAENVTRETDDSSLDEYFRRHHNP